MATEIKSINRLPQWLRRSLPPATAVKTHDTLGKYALNTVCESAICPNRSECYARRTATFMILGDICTRSCGFCAIRAGKGLAVEADEPERVAAAARDLGLKYVVVTSVARDDLEDEGAEHFAKTVRAIRRKIPDAQVEVLTPDFHGRRELIHRVAAAGPEVFNHNVETVRRLQKQVRPQAGLDRSLSVLRSVKEFSSMMTTKSGLMLGLGETEAEVFDVAAELSEAHCDILTIGQYLPPSQAHLPLVAYIEPEYFKSLAERLRPMGFKEIFAGPSVRSSYHAGEVFTASVEGQQVLHG